MNPVDCKYCKKTFARQFTLNRHNREQKCVVQNDPVLLKKYIEKSEIQMIKQIEELREEVEKLQQKSDHEEYDTKSQNSEEVEDESCDSDDESSDICPSRSESEEIIKNDNYVYIVKEREFIRMNENVYKIGMTRGGHFKRIKSYPKGSVLMCMFKVPNAKQYETYIKKSFDKHFIQRADIGREYYQADYQHLHTYMSRIVSKLTQKFNN